MNIKYISQKLLSSSYWLGRASEAFDQEDYLGSESCLKFFRQYNNCLLRAHNKGDGFDQAVNGLQSNYNDLMENLSELQEVEI